MPRESQRAKRQRAAQILAHLQDLYPDAKTELDFTTPFQLLIATILSAQATDVSVNLATPALFAKYPNAAAMSRAEPEEIEPFIRTIGLFRTKAKSLVATARALVAQYGGEVPATIEALISLRGVGRKTANVVVSNAYGVPAIAVDTHVGRLARRLDLTKQTDPDKVEADLQKLFPPEQWVFLHHALILHGRRVCAARNPRCAECALCPVCNTCGTFITNN
ncbi:MAG: endonuclease III [Trueperaceae bacterium]|nr:endonuclease III [Trueperaceae bacterium]